MNGNVLNLITQHYGSKFGRRQRMLNLIIRYGSYAGSSVKVW